MPDDTVRLHDGSACEVSQTTTDNSSLSLQYSRFITQETGTTKAIDRQIRDIVYTMITALGHRVTLTCRVSEDYATLRMQIGVADREASDRPLINARIYQSGIPKEEYLGLVASSTATATIDLQDPNSASPDQIALEMECQSAINKYQHCVMEVMEATLLTRATQS
ncbi:hypothetical protein PN498_13265 [Oscillatoria sp. CS-180]|uniref:hypothetical protein n=1 Tax=Oscillatoria sp. CS-180 TaxID=3021720 RepID=UPI00232EA84D|nr:hypothetical protein [Oscillatoria sp. CS-180]MDB9526963.1 hypothetical protein [Oscillatoria sp. CS-180]